jgi:hypothetical protein
METSIWHLTDRTEQPRSTFDAFITDAYCRFFLPRMQVPGKEFTRTCKGLVVVLLGGYALLHFVPSSIDYLTIIPAKYVSRL